MKIELASNKLIKSLVCIFYIASVMVQLLVISKAIPYTWVNGGRSESYDVQVLQSTISLIIIALLFIFILNTIKLNTLKEKWKLNVLYIITIFWVLGFIMQIMGTTFERFVLSLLLILGVVSHILLVSNVRTKFGSRPSG